MDKKKYSLDELTNIFKKESETYVKQQKKLREDFFAEYKEEYAEFKEEYSDPLDDFNLPEALRCMCEEISLLKKGNSNEN